MSIEYRGETFSGYNKPKRTPKHPKKSHVVLAKEGSTIKMIRFGEQGASTAGKPKAGESDKMKAKRKSFKARHGKNIARGKLSAAYWADKVKWQRNISMGLTKEEKADLKEDNETIALEIKIELLRKELAEEMRAKAEQERINKEAKKRDDAAGMNKGGMPKKNFAKPGSYSSAYNKGGITKKAKTGSMDYRKGGMTYSTSSKK